MKTEDRNLYIESYYAAHHTISGFVADVNQAATDQDPVVKTCHPKNDRYYIQLNPNKVVPGSMIKTFSEYKSVLEATMERIEATELQITRADLSFNSDDESHYEQFKKLHKLLISCLSEAYGVRNSYQSCDLWSNRSLSVAIKSDRFEAENYNKDLESHGTTEAKNRLELRSKRMASGIEEEFLVKWFERLDRAVEVFEDVQAHYNRELIRIWNEDQAKTKKEQEFVSLTAFVLRYKDCIFTRKQLQSLFEGVGVQNPKNRAKKFKDGHKIEFFSHQDLKIIVQTIKNMTKKYYNS